MLDTQIQNLKYCIWHVSAIPQNFARRLLLTDVTEWTAPCNQNASNSPGVLGDAGVVENRSGTDFFLERNYYKFYFLWIVLCPTGH